MNVMTRRAEYRTKWYPFVQQQQPQQQQLQQQEKKNTEKYKGIRGEVKRTMLHVIN